VDIAEQAERALDWFQRLVPRLRRLASILKAIAAVGIGAAALILLLLVFEFWFPSVGGLLVIGSFVGLLGFTPVMLWIFAGGVAALADLPGAIAASPELFRQHMGELSELYEKVVRPEARRMRSWGSGLLGGVRLSWRVYREFPDVGGTVGSVSRVSLILFAAVGLFMSAFNVCLIPPVAAFVALH
jgi:hypothetical protein